MMQLIKNDRGIALVTITVTVIIILIISIVSIAVLKGENGILSVATVAKEENTKESIRERLNLELTNIILNYKKNRKRTSKELSLEEFEKLGYETKKESEEDAVRCYIIEEGYIFEIEENEAGRQEVVYIAKANQLGPQILDIKLSVKNSNLEIETVAKRTDKFTYILSTNKQLINENNKQTSMIVDLKKLYDKYQDNENVNLFGTFKIKVIGEGDSGVCNKEKTINISQVLFDANGGKFDNNEDKNIVFIESGKKLSIINDEEIKQPTQNNCNFDDWYINDQKIIFDETTINEPSIIIKAGWNVIEHDYVLGSIIREPTCTETGIQQEICSICGDVKEVQIKELGHDYSEEYTVDIDPSCTEDGLESKHCSRCNSTKDERVVAALGHSYGEYTTTKNASCKEEGLQVRTCQYCGDVEEKTIAKSTTHTPGKAANCQHAQVCTICGIELNPKTTTHSYGTSKVSISSTQHAYKCTVCGATKDAGSHSWSGWKQYSSSNSNYKTKHYKQCSVCSTTSSANHSHSKYAYSVMNASQHFKKSTCACGYVISTNPENHNKNNPCTAQGYVSNAKCSLCRFCVKHSTTSH